MTYTDMFGMERHTPSCTCTHCNPPCGHTWNEGRNKKGPSHTCVDKSNQHNSRHHCQCGQEAVVHKPEGLNWWDPKNQKRKREREAADNAQ